MRRLFLAVAVARLWVAPADAQTEQPMPKLPSPHDMDMAASNSARAQARYPQQVRVAALQGRRLIEPEESQPILGRVKSIVRGTNGAMLVIETGGSFAWTGLERRREVVVAAADCALLGQWVVLADVDPDDFAKLPTYRSGSLPTVDPNSHILMGIVKPFH